MTRYEFLKSFPADRFARIVCEIMEVVDNNKIERFERMLKEEIPTKELQEMFSIALEKEDV